jgi:hypothetical protein
MMISDDGRLCTFTKNQQMGLPPQAERVGRQGRGYGRAVRAGGTKRPSRYKSRLPGHCPPT